VANLAANDEGNEGESKRKSGAPVYKLEEVGQHRGPESYWLAVGDSVYDVSSFILAARHPGGDLIDQGKRHSLFL
jgi:cytochrome b involved in lipid metabolism